MNSHANAGAPLLLGVGGRGEASVRAPRAVSGRTHQQHIAVAEPEEPRRRERQEDLPVDVLQRRLVALVESRRDAVLLRHGRCRGTQTHARRMQACTAQGLGKVACAPVHGRACEGRWGGVGVPATRRRRGRCPRAASCRCRSRCCRGAAPGWSNAAKSSAWTASGWKGTASRWGLRRWAPPHESGGQPQAYRCSLTSPWWPAMARPRRPL